MSVTATPRLARLAVASLLTAGCTRSTTSSSDADAAPPAMDANREAPHPDAPLHDPRPARTGRWPGSERTTLVAVEHQPQVPTASTVMLRIEGGLQDPGPAKQWPALQPTDEPAYRFVAGHGGASAYAVVQPSADGYALQWTTGGPGDPAAAVELGAEIPAAMTIHGNTVMLGIGTKLVEVSFDDATPTASIVHERTQPGTKAYDIFTSAGDWLVAIDDMGMPYYADSLRLDATGRADHSVGFSLPTLINGFYRAASLHRTGEGTGRLYVLVHFGVIDGYGHIIAGLEMQGGATVRGADFTLNEATGKHGVDEFTDRTTDEPVLLTTGKTMTDWSGMDVLAPEDGALSVLVAAQARGLLVFPTPLQPKTDPVGVLDLGAPCHDVLVDGSMVYALIDGEVVALEAEQARTALELVERGRVLVEGHPTRWAR